MKTKKAIENKVGTKRTSEYPTKCKRIKTKKINKIKNQIKLKKKLL